MRIKRKYTKRQGRASKGSKKIVAIVGKRKYVKKNGLPNMSQLIGALKYVITHPEVMSRKTA